MAGVWKPSEMFCCWLRKARIFPKKTSMDVYCHQIKKRGKCFNPNRFKVCLKNIAWSAVTRLLFECSWYKSTLFSYYKFTSNVRRCYVVVKLVHDRCVFNYMLSCWFSQLYLKLWCSAWAYTKLTNLLICFPLQISLFRFGSFPCKCWMVALWWLTIIWHSLTSSLFTWSKCSAWMLNSEWTPSIPCSREAQTHVPFS